MLISKSPHTTSLETVFTHLKSGSFHNGGRKKPPWWTKSPLYSLPKRGEDLSAFVHVSLKCCCLRNTTSDSPFIVSYWPLRVSISINHISLTSSTAFCLTFWNAHLHIAFHNTQITKEHIVYQTLSSTLNSGFLWHKRHPIHAFHQREGKNQHIPFYIFVFL